MEASRVCQVDKHDKERETLVPRILTGEESMRNGGRLHDWKDPKVSLHYKFLAKESPVLLVDPIDPADPTDPVDPDNPVDSADPDG
ncbi:hypothetical protein Tco_0018481 [Tanacetum coccineum]